MELTTYWCPKNVQYVLVLVDIGTELMLICSNPDHLTGPTIRHGRMWRSLHSGPEDPGDFG